MMMMLMPAFLQTENLKCFNLLQSPYQMQTTCKACRRAYICTSQFALPPVLYLYIHDTSGLAHPKVRTWWVHFQILPKQPSWFDLCFFFISPANEFLFCSCRLQKANTRILSTYLYSTCTHGYLCLAWKQLTTAAWCTNALNYKLGISSSNENYIGIIGGWGWLCLVFDGGMQHYRVFGALFPAQHGQTCDSGSNSLTTFPQW